MRPSFLSIRKEKGNLLNVAMKMTHTDPPPRPQMARGFFIAIR